MESKQRIEYIDLMKGICIILVVIGHTNVPEEFPEVFGVLNVIKIGRMPLYFFLSGLFFRTYSGFGDFAVRKFWNLIVPMLVFTVVPVVLLRWFFPSAAQDLNLCEIVHPLSFLHCGINFALWFLRTLFMALLIMYPLAKLDNGKWERRVLLTAIVVFISWLCWKCHYRVVAPCSDVSSFVPSLKYIVRSAVGRGGALLLFLWIGYLAGGGGMLAMARSRQSKMFAALMILSATCLLLILPETTDEWYILQVGDSWLLAVIKALLAIVIVWGVSFLAVRVPYVSYIGRYSIVVLCTHMLIIKPMRVYTFLPEWAIALIVFAVMPAVIWACVRWIPWGCAQRRVVEWRDGRLRLVRDKEMRTERV